MNTCYRGMPKFIGAFIDSLYQHPIMLIAIMAAISASVAYWWYKTGRKPE